MEQGDVDSMYAHPANPYTIGLLDSIPRLDARVGRLPAIPGLPPNLLNVPAGCPFHVRCTRAGDQCRTDPVPPLVEVGPAHLSACWFAEEVYANGK
jgi:oligopeptide transport system ATP-binding protein